MFAVQRNDTVIWWLAASIQPERQTDLFYPFQKDKFSRFVVQKQWEKLVKMLNSATFLDEVLDICYPYIVREDKLPILKGELLT